MRFAKLPSLQLALRELRADFTAPMTLTSLLGVTILLIIAGPFGTLALPVWLRAAYWAICVGTTYIAGSFIGICLHSAWPSQPLWRRVLVFGVLNGIFVTGIMTGINASFAAAGLIRWSISLGMIAAILPVAIVISALLTVLEDRIRQTPAAAAAQIPLLMDRLPPPMRGPLIALSAEDHYTRIRTARGEELVLVALRDAIREAAPTEGLQIHRSHWVALDQIARLRRTDGKQRLVLKDDTEIPVSRRYAPRLRDLGF